MAPVVMALLRRYCRERTGICRTGKRKRPRPRKRKTPLDQTMRRFRPLGVLQEVGALQLGVDVPQVEAS